MSKLFDDLSQGLEEAIAFEKGTGTARATTYVIEPVTEYNNQEIREIRNRAGMTQIVFANYLGVSKKTVEAWERGRTHPTGPAYRLISILAEGKENDLMFISKR
ncbi:MAG: helix-turn-helix domain-containing protein [Lachnospiraceae bacterium]|nr:helix-turn-helix domain-containing protein [Lachnospiraceae bacterium]MBR3261694.1 helix-turn-helix domain-containing protein [Lachnospiraceae bacterium]